jgi:hypothetical protein
MKLDQQTVVSVVAKVWADTLQCEPPQGGQHFFEDLGGNSLLAFQATVELRQLLDYRVPLRLLFTVPWLDQYATQAADLVAAAQR